jgi:hypothetical protein
MRVALPKRCAVLAIVSALAFAHSAMASQPGADPQEPNNTPRTAFGPLTAGTAYFGIFIGPEADWFWFGTPAAQQAVHVTIENTTIEASPCPVEYATLIEPGGTVTTKRVARTETATFDAVSEHVGDEFAVGLSLNGCTDTGYYPDYKLVVDSAQPLTVASDPCADLKTRRNEQRARVASAKSSVRRAATSRKRKAARARLARARRRLAKAQGRYEGCRYALATSREPTQ